MKPSERIRELARTRYLTDLDHRTTAVGTEGNYQFGALLDVLDELDAELRKVDKVAVEALEKAIALGRESADTLRAHRGELDKLRALVGGMNGGNR